MKEKDYTQTTTWKTRSGEVLHVKDLTSAHIRRILKYFHNQTVGPVREQMLRSVQNEAVCRGLDSTCRFAKAEILGDGVTFYKHD